MRVICCWLGSVFLSVPIAYALGYYLGSLGVILATLVGVGCGYAGMQFGFYWHETAKRKQWLIKYREAE